MLNTLLVKLCGIRECHPERSRGVSHYNLCQRKRQMQRFFIPLRFIQNDTTRFLLSAVLNTMLSKFCSTVVTLFTQSDEVRRRRKGLASQSRLAGNGRRDSFSPSFIPERGLRSVQNDMIHFLLNSVLKAALRARHTEFSRGFGCLSRECSGSEGYRSVMRAALLRFFVTAKRCANGRAERWCTKHSCVVPLPLGEKTLSVSVAKCETAAVRGAGGMTCVD